MEKKYRVLVLMSTYNGELYLESQLNSILHQQGIEIDLLIRDDGSIDKTLDILRVFSEKYTNITYYEGENIGYKSSFMSLVYNCKTEYDYFAFADQDDVWHEEKVIKAIKKMSQNNQIDTPTLYFSNAMLVNKNLDEIGILHKETVNFPTDVSPSIINVFALGCTMVFNKSVLKLIREYKIKEDFAHDYWIPLITGLLGKVIYDENAYFYYRQHENNVFGGIKRKFLDILKIKLTNYKDDYFFFSKTAQEIINGYKEYLTKEQLHELDFFINYRNSKMKKIKFLFSKKINRKSFKGTAYLKLLILLNKL